MKELTIQKWLELYEEGLLSNVICVKDKIYGRTSYQQAKKPERYIVVWASVP